MTAPATVDFIEPHEQFEDHAQQRAASTVGMWVFISNEVLFFGTIFTGFYLMRENYTNDFVQGANELKWWIGGLNTAVLLVSSYTMAMAVHAAHEGKAGQLFRRLIATAGLGIFFMFIKAFEYGVDYYEHLVPTLNYTRHLPDGTVLGPHVELFMIFYFIATALHALHVFIGIVIILIVSIPAFKNRYKRQDHNMIDGLGLYWHFVDLVWIFLYPTLYLLRHG